MIHDSEVRGQVRSRSVRAIVPIAGALLTAFAGCAEHVADDLTPSAVEGVEAALEGAEPRGIGAELQIADEVRRGELSTETVAAVLSLGAEDWVLYAEAQVDVIDPEAAEDVAFSASYRLPELPSTVVPPLEVPEAAWEARLGHEVNGVLVRFQAGERDSDMVTVQALVGRDRGIERIEAPPDDSADSVWREQIRQVQTGELSSLRDEDGTHLVTVLFEPRIRLDAVARGNWFGPRDPRMSAELIREVGAREGREIVAMASAASAVLFEAETGCTLARTLGVLHGARFRCSDENLARIATANAVDVAALEFNQEIDTSDMAGDDFRADVGAQLRLMLTRDDSNTLCHNGGGTRECHDGRQGANGSAVNVRVALIDSSGFFRAESLPSLHDTFGGSSRVQLRYACDDTSCSHDFTDGGLPNSHGAGAMLPAFQHTLQEQDVDRFDGVGCYPGGYNCSDTEGEQEDHTKSAYEADLYLYKIDNLAGLEEAVEHATDPSGAVDADILVLSGSAAAGSCESAPSTYSALAALWDSAVEDAEVVIVLSAENFINLYNDDCTANQLATRDDIVVVGAFGDTANPANFDYGTDALMNFDGTVISNATNCLDPFEPNICSRSAVGGADIRVGGTIRNMARAVVDVTTVSGTQYYQRWRREDGADGDDVAGDECVDEDVGDDADDTCDSNPFIWIAQSCCGTSMAAPLAAAAYTSFIDFVHTNSLSFAMHPTRIQAVLMLMADGERGGEGGGPAPTTDYVGMDNGWGAGRLLMRRFDDVGTNAPWTWGLRADWAYDNDVLVFRASSTPMNSDVDEFVAGIVWNEPYRNPAVSTNAADIELEIFTTVPSGGSCPSTPAGTETLVAEDAGYDTHKVVRIQSNNGSAFDGKCLYTRVRAVDVPSLMDGYYRRRVVTTTFFEDRDNEPSDLAANIE